MKARNKLQKSLKYSLKHHPEFPYNPDEEDFKDEIFIAKHNIRFLLDNGDTIDIEANNLNMNINYNVKHFLILSINGSIYHILWEKITGYVILPNNK